MKVASTVLKRRYEGDIPLSTVIATRSYVRSWIQIPYKNARLLSELARMKNGHQNPRSPAGYRRG